MEGHKFIVATAVILGQVWLVGLLGSRPPGHGGTLRLRAVGATPPRRPGAKTTGVRRRVVTVVLVVAGPAADRAASAPAGSAPAGGASIRGPLLFGQGEEVGIPTTKVVLLQHFLECKQEVDKMNSRLKLVDWDFAIMAMCLEMSDWGKRVLQLEQLALLYSVDACTRASFGTFDNDALEQKVSQLGTFGTQAHVKESLSDFLVGIEALESVELVEIGGHRVV